MDGSSRSFLTVAACQPETIPHDVAANVEAHARSIRDARARLAVFPEMSLTGYELDATTLDLHSSLLVPLVDAARDTDTVALVGAPIRDDGREYIATLRIDATGVSIAARKCWLHGKETERFTAAPAPSTTTVDGHVVGLAICYDTNLNQHTAALAHLGPQVYAASVLDVPADEHERQARSYLAARELRVPVVVSRYASPTSLYPQTSGRSFILDPTGQQLAIAAAEAGSTAKANLELDQPTNSGQDVVVVGRGGR